MRLYGKTITVVHKLIQPHITSKGWLVLLAVIATVVVGATTRTFADNGTADNQTHMITIYDGGVEQTVITRAKTVRGALEQARVVVEPTDIVEPALDEDLVAQQYSVNIYRARPVVIMDGVARVKTITAAQSPTSIAASAKIVLYPEDGTKLSRSERVLAEGGAGLKLQIDRATPVMFTQFGNRFEARTQATTVGGMLAEKGIVLGAQDGATPDLSTPISSGLEIRVWRNGKQTVTVEEVVAKPIEEIKDVDREVGYRQVKTPGTDGKRTATYEIDTQNGVEVSRKEIAAVVTLQPIAEVVIVGAKSRIVAYTGGGSKTEWLQAAGIPPDMWGYADSIVTRESGWNPNATNASSGACGLAQALPCSKVPGNPYNPVDSLRWMNGYVAGRYGGWAGAYNFWQANHWY